MGKVLSTIVVVVVAVLVSGGVWVAANLVFNDVRDRWARFTAIAYGIVGFAVVGVIHGNRLLRFESDSFVSWVWPPLVGAVVFVALGLAIGKATAQQRLVVATVGFSAIGIALGALMDDSVHPALEIGPLIGWTVAGVVIGGGIGLLRKKPPIGGALLGGALGWIAGGWGMADIGDGSSVEAIIATAVPAVAIGVRAGLGHAPTRHERIEIDRRSRAVIFLAPALLFISVTLVIPALRTLYLSLLDDRSEDFVGLDNYQNIFTNEVSFDGSNWTNMFGSRLFWIGLVLLVIAVVLGTRQKRVTGKAVELGGPSMSPLLIGGLLLLFAVFTSLRGTIINNLWWVVTVTFLSTSLGLAVAVLADRAPGERAAKSIIFMPMAISLVGASIIWRFMYIPRDASEEQTGVMNSLWVALGKLSTGSGIPTYVGGVIAGLVLVGLAYGTFRALRSTHPGRAAVPGALTLLVLWFFVRYWGIVGDGVGGFQIREDGVIRGQPIGFIQEPPYNNFWLMVILIWIQTGFAMVILSAAIKAVPTEFIEAARVDGATESQIFWRVTLPQISTTIGVVVTTLIVLVMKVYDIVKVVTNGNFGTQVLANDMYQQSFQFGNIGQGAALAILILVSVLPVMYLNIRRMQREA